jgi:hypothetical protein
MWKWEEGELDDDETIRLFQLLIDCGSAWKLQGVYGRFAMQLIQAGLCQLPADAPEWLKREAEDV